MTKVKQIARLKKKLDKAWSEAVRKRDGKCLMCSKAAPEHVLHAHHWFIRKARSLLLRWDMTNGVALCYYCHLKELHGNQSDYIFLKKYIQNLHAKFGTVIQYRFAGMIRRKFDPTILWMELKLDELRLYKQP